MEVADGAQVDAGYHKGRGWVLSRRAQSVGWRSSDGGKKCAKTAAAAIR